MIPRMVRLLLLMLAPFTCAGCLTAAMWKASPDLHAERLLGASFDADGGLILGVELSDGRRRRFHESGVSSDWMAMTVMVPPDDSAQRWSLPPNPTGDAIELPGTFRGAPNGEPVFVKIT